MIHGDSLNFESPLGPFL